MFIINETGYDNVLIEIGAIDSSGAGTAGSYFNDKIITGANIPLSDNIVSLKVVYPNGKVWGGLIPNVSKIHLRSPQSDRAVEYYDSSESEFVDVPQLDDSKNGGGSWSWIIIALIVIVLILLALYFCCAKKMK